MLKKELSWFIEANAGSIDDPRFLWDAPKGCIRSSSISYRGIGTLETKLNRLENCLQMCHSEDVQKERNLIRTELNSLL